MEKRVSLIDFIMRDYKPFTTGYAIEPEAETETVFNVPIAIGTLNSSEEKIEEVVIYIPRKFLLCKNKRVKDFPYEYTNLLALHELLHATVDYSPYVYQVISELNAVADMSGIKNVVPDFINVVADYVNDSLSDKIREKSPFINQFLPSISLKELHKRTIVSKLPKNSKKFNPLHLLYTGEVPKENSEIVELFKQIKVIVDRNIKKFQPQTDFFEEVNEVNEYHAVVVNIYSEIKKILKKISSEEIEQAKKNIDKKNPLIDMDSIIKIKEEINAPILQPNEIKGSNSASPVIEYSKKSSKVVDNRVEVEKVLPTIVDFDQKLIPKRLLIKKTDPTGISLNRSNFDFSTRGRFKFNVKGLIDMKTRKEPRLFQKLTAKKVEKKRVLFYYDISGSMRNINYLTKPIIKRIIETKVRIFVEPFILNFSTVIAEEPKGDLTAVEHKCFSGTDPITSPILKYLRGYLFQNRIKVLVIVSDMDFGIFDRMLKKFFPNNHNQITGLLKKSYLYTVISQSSFKGTEQVLLQFLKNAGLPIEHVFLFYIFERREREKILSQFLAHFKRMLSEIY